MKESSAEAAYQYVAYIDESGDPGLRSVRPANPNGSSEWLVVAAVLIRRRSENLPSVWMEELRSKFSNFRARDIHFADLNSTNKLIACEYLSRRLVTIFAICSNKKNMVGYKNPFAELRSLDKNWFYCWLSRVLLERLTHFVRRDAKYNSISNPKLKLVFSHRGGMSYSQMKAYSELLKLQTRVGGLFINSGQVYFDVLDMKLMEVVEHSRMPALKLPDIAASAFFKACDIHNTGSCDPKYAAALKPRVASIEHMDEGEHEAYTTYAGYGVKILPSFKGAKLKPQQGNIFRLYGYPRQWWDSTPHTPSPYRLATLSPTVALDASN